MTNVSNMYFGFSLGGSVSVRTGWPGGAEDNVNASVPVGLIARPDAVPVVVGKRRRLGRRVRLLGGGRGGTFRRGQLVGVLVVERE